MIRADAIDVLMSFFEAQGAVSAKQTDLVYKFAEQYPAAESVRTLWDNLWSRLNELDYRTSGYITSIEDKDGNTITHLSMRSELRKRD